MNTIDRIAREIAKQLGYLPCRVRKIVRVEYSDSKCSMIEGKNILIHIHDSARMSIVICLSTYDDVVQKFKNVYNIFRLVKIVR